MGLLGGKRQLFPPFSCFRSKMFGHSFHLSHPLSTISFLLSEPFVIKGAFASESKKGCRSYRGYVEDLYFFLRFDLSLVKVQNLDKANPTFLFKIQIKIPNFENSFINYHLSIIIK
ncbi:MAG: hypothetical protein DI529_04440 [Chryseobacterium sp.]|nr:MAG: hypothetical protein DI529_04440 [Chryseobacterium sp.]